MNIIKTTRLSLCLYSTVTGVSSQGYHHRGIITGVLVANNVITGNVTIGVTLL